MHSVNISPVPFGAALFAAALLASVTASAASQCKGMQQDSCMASAKCIWVNGYERKDGRSVSSHCKTRAKGKSANQAALGR